MMPGNNLPRTGHVRGGQGTRRPWNAEHDARDQRARRRQRVGNDDLTAQTNQPHRRARDYQAAQDEPARSRQRTGDLPGTVIYADGDTTITIRTVAAEEITDSQEQGEPSQLPTTPSQDSAWDRIDQPPVDLASQQNLSQPPIDLGTQPDEPTTDTESGSTPTELDDSQSQSRQGGSQGQSQEPGNREQNTTLYDPSVQGQDREGWWQDI